MRNGLSAKLIVLLGLAFALPANAQTPPVARANAAAPTWAEDALVPLSVDLGGVLRCTTSGGGGGGTSSTFGAAFPATGTAAGWYDGSNMQGARVFDCDTGGGTQYIAGFNLRIPASGGSAAADAGAGATSAATLRVEGNQGAAAAGAGAWPVTVTNTADTVVKPGDAVNNAVRVNVVAGAAAGGTSSSFGAAFPASGTAAGFNDGANMQGAKVYDVDTGGGTDYAAGATLRIGASGGSIPVTAGAGTTAAGTIRVVLPTDQTVIPVSDNGGSLTVDGTVSVSGSVDTELPAAAALADNTANPTAPAVGSFLMAWDGANWDRVQTGAAATGSVKVDGSAVTQPVSGTVSLTGLPIPVTTSNALVDNTAFVDGSTQVGMSGYVFDEVAGTALAENDAAAARVDAKRAQVTVLEDPTTRGQRASVVSAGSGSLSVNTAAVNGGNVPTGTGASGSTTQRVTVANDSNVLVTQSTSPWVTRDDSSLVDNAAFTDGTSRVLPEGQIFDEVAGTALTENDVVASRINANRATIAVLEDDTARGRRVAVAAGQSTTTRVRPELAQNSLVASISPNNSGLPVNVPVKVQTSATSSTGNVASLLLAFGSNNVAGNSIVAVCGVGVSNVPTMADSAGNTYRKIVSQSLPAPRVDIFLAVNVAAGANTVTCTNTGAASSMAITIYEFSGFLTNVTTSQPGVVAASNGSSVSATTIPISPTGANEYAVAGVVLGTAAQTITPATGWTNDSGQLNPTTPSGLFSMVAMSQFLEGLMPGITPSATFTSEPWAIAVASFKTVNVAVGGSVHLVFGGPQDATGEAGPGTAAGLPLVATADTGWVSAAPSMTGTTFPSAAIIGQFDDVTPGSTTENQFGHIRESANRNLYTTMRDAAGNERGANVSAGNALKVGIVGNADGAFDAANNAAAPANVIVGGFETATQTVTQPAAATAGNVRRGVTRTDGALYVVPGGPVMWSCGLNAIGTTLTQCQAAPGASLRLYITDVVSQSNTATAGLFTLRFGTGANCGTGTGNLIFNSAAALMASPGNTVAVNDFHLTTPIPVTANNAVCVLGVVTNTTNIQILGYTAP